MRRLDEGRCGAEGGGRRRLREERGEAGAALARKSENDANGERERRASSERVGESDWSMMPAVLDDTKRQSVSGPPEAAPLTSFTSNTARRSHG